MHNNAPAFIWRQSRALSHNLGFARLESWSEVYAPLSGHESYAPYIVAIVKLSDDHMCTAQIVDCEATDLTMGMELVPVFRRIYDTGPSAPIVYGYKFAPKAY